MDGDRNDRGYEAFAVTLCEVLRQMAEEARNKKKFSVGSESEDFYDGYLSGFHRVITLIQQQAELFDIPLSELSMDDINDTDLM